MLFYAIFFGWAFCVAALCLRATARFLYLPRKSRLFLTLNAIRHCCLANRVSVSLMSKRRLKKGPISQTTRSGRSPTAAKISSTTRKKGTSSTRSSANPQKRKQNYALRRVMLTNGLAWSHSGKKNPKISPMEIGAITAWSRFPRTVICAVSKRRSRKVMPPLFGSPSTIKPRKSTLICILSAKKPCVQTLINLTHEALRNFAPSANLSIKIPIIAVLVIPVSVTSLFAITLNLR